MTELPALVTELTEEIAGLRDELAGTAKRQRAQTWSIRAGVAVAAVLIWAVADNRSDIEANNRLLCPVLAIVGSDNPPRETAAGRAMVTEIYRLGHRPEYGCW